VAVGLRGVIRKGLIGRRRRRIPLNQPEKEMIVKTRRRSKMNQRREIDDHCLLRVLALLPSASSEARRRLRRRTILFWDVHCWERRTGVDKFDLKIFVAGVNCGTKSLLSRN
jgi:hypothetical protein